jgi:hypothetical protein
VSVPIVDLPALHSARRAPARSWSSTSAAGATKLLHRQPWGSADGPIARASDHEPRLRLPAGSPPNRWRRPRYARAVRKGRMWNLAATR